VFVRPCTTDDACVSDGVLVADSREGVEFFRIEERLVNERFASAAFRLRQTITERNPQPDSTHFGGGIIWLDDGVKATVIGFAEEVATGAKVVLMAIEGHPDPETGELNIIDVLVTVPFSVMLPVRIG
jgi:hypothetical protein